MCVSTVRIPKEVSVIAEKSTEHAFHFSNMLISLLGCSQWDDTDKEEEKLTLLESDRLYKVCFSTTIFSLCLFSLLSSMTNFFNTML